MARKKTGTRWRCLVQPEGYEKPLDLFVYARSKELALVTLRLGHLRGGTVSLVDALVLEIAPDTSLWTPRLIADEAPAREVRR